MNVVDTPGVKPGQGYREKTCLLLIVAFQHDTVATLQQQR